MYKSNKDLKSVVQNYTYFSIVLPKFKYYKKQYSLIDNIKITFL